jgi:hypothetical protein
MVPKCPNLFLKKKSEKFFYLKSFCSFTSTNKEINLKLIKKMENLAISMANKFIKGSSFTKLTPSNKKVELILVANFWNGVAIFGTPSSLYGKSKSFYILFRNNNQVFKLS